MATKRRRTAEYGDDACSPVASSSCIMMSNFDGQLTSTDLQRFLSSHGVSASAVCLNSAMEVRDGLPLGKAIVRLATEESASEAMTRLHGVTLNDRPVDVKLTAPLLASQCATEANVSCLGPGRRVGVADGVDVRGRRVEVPGSVSVRGARARNEDAACEVMVTDARGNVWIVLTIADGHGCSVERADVLVRHFCVEAVRTIVSDVDQLSSPAGAAEALARWLQTAAEATDARECSGGSTIVATLTDLVNNHVHVLSLGDSQALLVHADTGKVVQDRRVYWRDWADPAVRETDEVVEFLTLAHDGNSETELERYAKALPNHRINSISRPGCLPFEHRKLVTIDGIVIPLEPLRSIEPEAQHQVRVVGDVIDLKPLQRLPEIQTWLIPSSPCYLLLSCDGPFSKNAFPSPAHLASFLSSPSDYAALVPRSLLPQMRVSGWLRACQVDLDRDGTLTFADLLQAIRTHISRAVDALWMTAFSPSLMRLEHALGDCSEGENEEPPTMSTDPWGAMLLAADFAITHLSDDNVTLSCLSLTDRMRVE